MFVQQLLLRRQPKIFLNKHIPLFTVITPVELFHSLFSGNSSASYEYKSLSFSLVNVMTAIYDAEQQAITKVLNDQGLCGYENKGMDTRNKLFSSEKDKKSCLPCNYLAPTTPIPNPTHSPFSVGFLHLQSTVAWRAISKVAVMTKKLPMC